MSLGNLLLVDDEELILQTLRVTLKNVPAQIYTALDGLEALKVINEVPIHAVITDIKMPNMNGIDLAKEIRKSNNQVPIVFFTAHGNRDLLEEAILLGAFDFLDKPHMERLEEVVRMALAFGRGEFSFDLKSNEDIDQIQQLLIDQIRKYEQK